MDMGLFLREDISQGTKNLTRDKAQDIGELQVDYFKWRTKTLTPNIKCIFNNVI